jgi:predicted nucleic acid-binding protein
MRFYLDTNVFYHRFCPVDQAEITDWIFNQLTPENPGISSQWIIPEMFRALKKQVNLSKIDENDAQIAIDFFLSEIGLLSKKRILVLYPVEIQYLFATRDIIFKQNLYAADAVHIITAQFTNATSFITFDTDFSLKLNSIPILNPSSVTFKQEFTKIMNSNKNSMKKNKQTSKK